MFKNGVLTINYDTWKDGIAPSPYSGLADLRNADIYTKPGALLCGFKATKESGTTVTDMPVQIVYDDKDDISYAVDESGVVYRRVSGTWSQLATGKGDKGMILWKRHLLVFDNASIDVYAIDTDSWTNTWQSFAEGTRGGVSLVHTALHAQDDVLYITDGKFIASLTEASGATFDPGTGATFTWNNQALDLPDDYVASTLTEFGDSISIGTYFGAAKNRGNRADSFFWSPTSNAGAFTFDDTKLVKGNGVWQSITQGNVFYQIIDRSSGRIYASNLSEYQLEREIRNIPYSSNVLDLHHGAIDIIDDQILFGVGSNNSGVNNLGVYGFKNRTLHLQNTTSAGDTRVEIGAVEGIDGNQYLIGWNDGTNSGIDLVDDTRMDSYGTSMTTPIYTIGTALEDASLTQINVNLGKPLASGQGVRVSYRENLSDSFTTMHTFDFDTYGAVSQMNQPSTISSASQIQLKVEMTANTSSTDTPELISIDLY